MNVPAGNDPNSSTVNDPQSSMHALVSGRVQGVGFRFFVLRKGRHLRLAGSARNLPDGRVEVYARGPKAALLQFEDLLRRGPLLSRVERMDVEWDVPIPQTTEFIIGF